MDRLPHFEDEPEPETPEERRRKRRLLGRLPGEEGAFFEQAEAEEDGSFTRELWTRDHAEAPPVAETDLPLDLPEVAGHMQDFGQEVLGQARAVGEFAHSLRAEVNELPDDKRSEIAPEATRLNAATEQLDTASEELEDELEELDETMEEPAASAVGPEVAAVTPPVIEKAKPTEEKPASGMAQLVIATLIGGGLGALFGEGAKKRREAKEKANVVKQKEKAEQTVREQEVKLTEQKVELQQLKAERQAEPAAPLQKEFVKSASELAERQADLTRETAEQVKAVTQTVETDRTFRIPEQPAMREHVPAPAEVLQAAEKAAEQSPEQMKDRTGQQGDKQDQPVTPEFVHTPSGGATPSLIPSRPQSPLWQQPVTPPRRQTTQTWLYVGLLLVAVAITLGLLLFGSR